MTAADDSESSAMQGRTNLLSRMITHEAVLVLLMSGLAYLFAYFHKRAYFIYFGIDPAYISVDIGDLLVSAGVVAALAVTFLSMWWLWLLPAKLYEYLLLMLVAHLPALLFIALFSIRMYFSGADWKTGALLAIAIGAIIWDIVLVYIHERQGGGYRAFLIRAVELENRIEQLSLRSKAIDLLGPSAAAIIVFAALIPFGIGSLSGIYRAHTQRAFSVYEQSGGIFLVVASYADGLLLTKVVGLAPGEAYLPQRNEVIWVSNADLSGVPLYREVFSEGVQAMTAPD